LNRVDQYETNGFKKQYMYEFHEEESSASQAAISTAILKLSFRNRNNSLSQYYMASNGTNKTNNEQKSHENQVSIVVNNC